jgi:lipopolysaccharide/colanic/teichoic acid biosynthesis glycosyltransferase
MFDIVVALLVLGVFALPMLVVAISIRLTSNGKALFAQQRVGRGNSLFTIYKFRSMAVASAANLGPGLTASCDERVTPLGRRIRYLKLDELPQFYNVLRGDMSLVGPRPKLPQYAAIANMPYRPGITGVASLVFRHEEEILGCCRPVEMERLYRDRIQPLKARLDVRYMARATFLSDLEVIGATFLSCVAPHSVSTFHPSRLSRQCSKQSGPPPDRETACAGN